MFLSDSIGWINNKIYSDMQQYRTTMYFFKFEIKNFGYTFLIYQEYWVASNALINKVFNNKHNEFSTWE